MKAVVHLLAQRYGAGSPGAILAWPYEDFLTAVEVGPRLAQTIQQQPDVAASSDPAVLTNIQDLLGRL